MDKMPILKFCFNGSLVDLKQKFENRANYRSAVNLKDFIIAGGWIGR